MRKTFCAAAALMSGTAAWAEVPRVAADIAPVQSLVAMVMGDLGQPDLIIPPSISPHGATLKPSQARALSQADIVVWMGPGLATWLEDPVETLAESAVHLELLGVNGSLELPYREDGHDHHGHDDHGDEGDGDHGHEEHGHEEHGHEEHGHDGHDDHDKDHGETGHDDHGHDDHGHDDHGHDDHGHDDHDDEADHHDHHGDVDPHAWLDPVAAQAWLPEIAEALGALDPDNAATYATNAEEAVAELDSLTKDLSAMLEPVHALPFVTFHDAYQYFEARFDLNWAGSVAASDAADPSAAALAQLRNDIEAHGVSCALSEIQYNDSLLTAAGPSMRIVEIDPLGARLESGPLLYPQVLREMATKIVTCLGG